MISVKKLTIGIVTYNNPSSLKDELDCIMSQIKKNLNIEKDIEILVSDNSDNDETELIINKFFSNISNLIYLKNEKNIGFDRNVDQVLTKSNGLFCWTLSDNDLISDGGIQKILNTIEDNLDTGHILISKDKTNREQKVYENMEDLIISSNYNIVGGLISQNIFNKKLLPVDRHKYYDNLWFHLSIILEVGSKKNITLIPNLLKDNPDHYCRWAKNGATFITYTNLHSIIMNLRSFGYSEIFLDTYHKIFIRGLPHQVATAKLYGLKLNRKNLITLYNNSSKEPVIFLICFLIIICPVFIIKIAKNI